jgi:uroporphyrinogen-III synthase
VWITRAEPGAGETAARVRDLGLGLEPVIEPLLEVRALDIDGVDLAGIGAIAFTSANAVRAFAERWPPPDLPVFAVGGATARAAQASGFARVQSADGDVAALARLIVERRGDLSGPVLHPSAAEAAGDLTGDLAAAGVAARRLALYETVLRTPGPSAAGLLAGEVIALLHSPRAARALADWIAGRDAERLTALCLSPAVAAALDDAKIARVRAAPTPNEDALIAQLADEALAA